MADAFPIPGPCVGLCNSSQNCDSSPDVCGKYLRLKNAAVLAPDLAEAVEELQDATRRWSDSANGTPMFALTLKSGLTLLRHARSGGLSEGQRDAVRGILAATYSHVDGRDLLAELHPRHMLDIIRRVDGRETRHEGDWLSELMVARDKLRAAFPAVFEKEGGE